MFRAPPPLRYASGGRAAVGGNKLPVSAPLERERESWKRKAQRILRGAKNIATDKA